jgi:uncharacterized protein involved in tolerance to divalent cations
MVYNPEGDLNQNPENRPEKEETVEAIKISTVFPEQKILEQIADKLLTEGVISGFHIDKTLSGYIFGGKKIEEDQYSLEILIDASTSDEVRDRIKNTISTVIGKKWEVPAIEEERVNVNAKLLNFIKHSQVEHGKYINEKKKRFVFALAGLLGLSTTLATLSERYMEHREQDIATVERKRAHDKVEEMLQKVQDQTRDIDFKAMNRQPLTPSPGSEMGVAYEETAKILDTIHEVEFEMRKLARGEQK